MKLFFRLGIAVAFAWLGLNAAFSLPTPGADQLDEPTNQMLLQVPSDPAQEIEVQLEPLPESPKKIAIKAGEGAIRADAFYLVRQKGRSLGVIQIETAEADRSVGKITALKMYKSIEAGPAMLLPISEIEAATFYLEQDEYAGPNRPISSSAGNAPEPPAGEKAAKPAENPGAGSDSRKKIDADKLENELAGQTDAMDALDREADSLARKIKAILESKAGYSAKKESLAGFDSQIKRLEENASANLRQIGELRKKVEAALKAEANGKRDALTGIANRVNELQRRAEDLKRLANSLQTQLEVIGEAAGKETAEKEARFDSMESQTDRVQADLQEIDGQAKKQSDAAGAGGEAAQPREDIEVLKGRLGETDRKVGDLAEKLKALEGMKASADQERLDRLNEKIEALKSRSAKLAQDLGALAKKLADAEAAQNAETEKRLEDLAARVKAANEKIDGIEKRAGVEADKAGSANQDDIAKIQKNMAALREDIGNMAGTVAVFTEQISAIKDSRPVGSEQAEELSRRIQATEERIAGLAKSLDAIEKRLGEQEAAAQSADARLSDLGGEIGETKKRVDEIAQKVESQGGKIEALSPEEAEKTKSEMADLAKAIESLQARIGEIVGQVDKQAGAIDELSKKSGPGDNAGQIEKLGKEIAATQESLKEISGQISAQAGQIAALQGKIDADRERDAGFAASIKKLEEAMLKGPPPSLRDGDAMVAGEHWSLESLKLLAREGILKEPSLKALDGKKTFTRYEISLIVASLLRTIEESGDMAVQYVALIEKLSREFSEDIDGIERQIAANSKRIDEMDERLAGQDAKIEDASQRIAAVESEEATYTEAITVLDREIAAQKQAEGNKLGGFITKQDGRIRAVTISRKTEDDDFTLEGRFRIALFRKKSAHFAFGARLTTGNGLTPGSDDTRFGDSTTNKSFTFDRLYGQWRVEKGLNFFGLKARPKDGLDLYLGKFPNPFTHTEMTWDNDYQPEGFAQIFKLGRVRNFGGVTVRTAQIALAQSSNTKESWMHGSQVTAEKVLFDHIGGSAALYEITNPETVFESAYTNGDIVGPTNNSTIKDPATGDDIAFAASGFRTLDLMLGYETMARGQPLSAVYNFIKNLDNGTNGKGRRYELSLGSTKDPRSLKFAYVYQDIEPDAVLSPFSDFEFGGSDSRGSKFNLHYRSTDEVVYSLQYYRYRDQFRSPGAVPGGIMTDRYVFTLEFDL